VWHKFLLGMVSCAAPLPGTTLPPPISVCVPRSDSGDAVVNPIEVIKTRLQLQGELQEEKARSGLSRIYGKGTAGPPTAQ
jgi:hypothetical protein